MPDRVDRTTTNPLFGDQPFKLGLFAYLHRGGMFHSVASDRWMARWDEIAEMARRADAGGLDFLIPIASWKGWRGEIDHRRWSFETLTQAAALGAITKRIGLVSTVHATLVNPIIAAKAMTTIDHISHGRSALNIVSGWNKPDFDMFGFEPLPVPERYPHAQEWFDIFSRILSDGANDFDYDGAYFKNMREVSGEPLSYQDPLPGILTAAYSPDGRDFAINTSDVLLTAIGDAETIKADIADIRAREAAAGRSKPPLQLMPTVQVFCRESRQAALDYHHYVNVETLDKVQADKWRNNRDAVSALPPIDQKLLQSASLPGVLAGTPKDVAGQMIELKNAGYAGAAMLLFDYVGDQDIIIEQVLPLLEKAGLRTPALQPA